MALVIPVIGKNILIEDLEVVEKARPTLKCRLYPEIRAVLAVKMRSTKSDVT
jgi:hypothetical protein